jgi:hypothetical protein
MLAWPGNGVIMGLEVSSGRNCKKRTGLAGAHMEVSIMDRNPNNLATTSTNSKAFGAFLFLLGFLLTFGTFGTGIVIGGPMMLCGIAYPIWRNTRLGVNARSFPHQYSGEDMSQREVANTGGVVMSRDEASRVANDAHRETRERMRRM